MSSDLEFEPIPGLPHELPEGERIVWQGSPQWKSLARHTFKVRWLAAYFAVFATTRLVVAAREGQGLAGLRQLLLLSCLGACCLGVLCLMAFLNARATMYTITTRRIVLRIGVALPTTWNLPFKRLAAAELAARTDGDGDIVLKLKAPDRIAWLQLWPHAQPWHFANARPTLRTIAEPARVASLLAEAVRHWAEKEAAPVLVPSRHRYAEHTTELVSPIEVVSHGVITEAGR